MLSFLCYEFFDTAAKCEGRPGVLNLAVIDTRILLDNIRKIRQCMPSKAKFAAVVKGDAYGHGLKLITGILDRQESIDMLVVASFREALFLYEEDIGKPTLILGRESVRDVEKELQSLSGKKRKQLMEKLIFSVYSGSGLDDYESLCAYGEVKVHLRLDFESGLRGFDLEDFKKSLGRLKQESGVRITGLYAHIYSAYAGDYDKTYSEILSYEEAFNSINEEVRKKLTIHLFSSSLCYRFPEYAGDMMRIGALMYGIGRRREQGEPDVKEVMSIVGRVLKIVDLGSGIQTDYSGKLPENVRRVALLSFGSWDIPFFMTAGKPVVRIRGKLVPIVGEPCMDSCLADITQADDVEEFDEVQVIGDYPGIRFDDWVDRSGLDFGNCQTLFAGIGRIQKYYIDEDGHIHNAETITHDKAGGGI